MINKIAFALPRAISVMANLYRSASTLFSDPYRPELHYMRGPGPKWREKHQAQPARAAMLPDASQRFAAEAL